MNDERVTVTGRKYRIVHAQGEAFKYRRDAVVLASRKPDWAEGSLRASEEFVQALPDRALDDLIEIAQGLADHARAVRREREQEERLLT